jgi:hypothetical protein
MPLSEQLRAFYTQSSPMTALTEHPLVFDGVPSDLEGIARTIQGFLIHEHWAPAYRQRLTPERRAESQLRTTEEMLTATLARNDAPLTTKRPLYQKTVGVCRHFTVLAVAMLRSKGIPARSRCGFGAYFSPGKFEDHWVAEYWDGNGWKLTDSQIDASQREILRLDMNLQDVPRDRFVIAGDAWQQCRSGHADPGAFGIFEMRGYWFIAGNVIRDFAALNNMELLPWDSWGAMTGPDVPIPDETLTLLDRVAALTLDPDTRFAELRALYNSDERLRVPPKVFNIASRKLEDIATV